MKLSIVIPARNEEKRISRTLESYAEYFQKLYGDDVEILVVANGCSDHTEDVVRRMAERYACIRLMVQPEKTGKGGAVRMGMKECNGDLIGFFDADGATPPQSIRELIQHMGSADGIIGSRWVEGAVVSPRQSWMRRLASRMLNALFVRSLFRLDVRDSQCGAKIFRRAVVQEILPAVKESSWAFDIELLCRAKNAGYRILEHPIEWHHKHGNPTSFLIMSLQMLASVWRVKAGTKSNRESA